MRILATTSIKGGVGKTATAVNLAWLAACDGRRTLVWDLDPQGAATFHFRVRAKVKGGGKRLLEGAGPLDRHLRGTDFEGLDLLPADFSYRKLDLFLDRMGRPRKRIRRLLSPLRQSYDLVVLDCAPGISLVAEAVFRAADALLVPTIPTPLSLRALERLQRRLRGLDRRKPELMPFFCMVDRRRALHRRFVGEASDGMLPASIPYSGIVERMSVERAPVGVYAPRARVAQDYRELWRVVGERLGLVAPPKPASKSEKGRRR